MSEEKKLDSSGAYVVLNDEQRTEKEKYIDNMINVPPFSSVIKDTGLFLTKKNEKLPIFGPIGDVEYVISRAQGAGGRESHAGARIVLTKDNYGHRGTGLGGHGFTMCEAIDIVAGSLSSEKRNFDYSTKSRANFITDGARIYLTERGDIQHYFAIGKRSEATSISSNLKSGIGMKADHTLIMGRERVLILAGLALAEGGDRTVSQNENVVPKIELARTNGGDSQPAVLGTALTGYLREIQEEIQQLRNDIQTINSELNKYKYAIATHQHDGYGLGAVTVIPSFETISEAAKSIGKFLNFNERQSRATINSEQTQMKRTGTSDGTFQGTIEDRILSSTVYIGK